MPNKNHAYIYIHTHIYREQRLKYFNVGDYIIRTNIPGLQIQLATFLEM